MVCNKRIDNMEAKISIEFQKGSTKVLTSNTEGEKL